jgi:putative flippase GtrA
LQKIFSSLTNDYKKKLRFLLTGVVNTIVGLSVYPLLYMLFNPIGLGYMGALFLAQVISITFSFVSIKYFVFKTKGNIKKEYVKFFMFYGICIALNLIYLPLAVELLNFSPIMSQTIYAILIIFTSYFWHNFYTFKRSTESN